MAHGHIALHKRIQKSEMMQALAVRLFSDLSEVSLEKVLTTFALFDCVVPKVDRVSYI